MKKTFRYLIIAVFFVASVSGGTHARAETVPASSASPVSVPASDPNIPADPERLALAGEMATLLGIHQQYRQTFDGMESAVETQIAGDNPNQAGKVKEMVSGIYADTYSKCEGKMTRSAATVLAGAYSSDELRQIIAFFKTPAGAKFIETQDSVVQKSVTAGYLVVLDAGKEGIRKTTEAVKTNNLKLSPETEKNLQKFSDVTNNTQNSLNQCATR